jgi:hypothetical protein
MKNKCKKKIILLLLYNIVDNSLIANLKSDRSFASFGSKVKVKIYFN